MIIKNNNKTDIERFFETEMCSYRIAKPKFSYYLPLTHDSNCDIAFFHPKQVYYDQKSIDWKNDILVISRYELEELFRIGYQLKPDTSVALHLCDEYISFYVYERYSKYKVPARYVSYIIYNVERKEDLYMDSLYALAYNNYDSLLTKKEIPAKRLSAYWDKAYEYFNETESYNFGNPISDLKKLVGWCGAEYQISYRKNHPEWKDEVNKSSLLSGTFKANKIYFDPGNEDIQDKLLYKKGDIVAVDVIVGLVVKGKTRDQLHQHLGRNKNTLVRQLRSIINKHGTTKNIANKMKIQRMVLLNNNADLLVSYRVLPDSVKVDASEYD